MPKIFLVVWKVCCVLSVVVPVIPLVSAEVGDIPLLTSTCCVGHGPSDLNMILGHQIIDLDSPLKAVVPERQW